MSVSVFSRVRSLIAAPDVAVDLGNANTRVYALGRGLVADEPSMLAVRRSSGSVVAVGGSAARLAEDSDLRHVYPLRFGVVNDVDAAAELLEPLLGRACGRLSFNRKPRVLVCAPTVAVPEEREALIEATRRAGAVSVTIAAEPIAAAIGAGLDIGSPYAQMLVDIGDGVTDIAVIRSGKLVRTSAMRMACSNMHAAVRSRVAREHGVLLLPREAERLTRSLGAAHVASHAGSLIVEGTDERTGERTTACVTSAEVCEAIEPIVREIVDSVRSVVNDLPATMACEVIESGISLAGGGATLTGLASLVAAETSLDVRPAADPLRAVIDGARQMLAVAVRTGMLVGS